MTPEQAETDDQEQIDEGECEREPEREVHAAIVARRRPLRASGGRCALIRGLEGRQRIHGSPRADQAWRGVRTSKRSATSKTHCTSSANAAAGNAPASIASLSLTARPAPMRSPKPPAPMKAASVAVPTLMTAAVFTPAISVGVASGNWT